MAATVLTAVVLAGAVCGTLGFTTGNETALRSAIFTGYDYHVRPTAVTNVDLSFLPTSLGGIDIKEETMKITGWWMMSWNDTRLTWVPANYDSIAETYVYQDFVWTPPIIVYNSVDNLSAIDEDTIPLRVQSSGLLTWTPPGSLTVTCNTDITYFPFDTQNCDIVVTTFGYTINELTVTPTGVNATFYQGNGEWNLEGHSSKGSYNGDYTFVTYSFTFKRKPAYYGLNFILPVLLCWVLSVFIFVLPAQSGEKMGYSLTVLLSFVVLMTLLAQEMPTTADHTSYLEVYIILVLSFCTVSVSYSVLNLGIYFREESDPVPQWVRRFTLFTRFTAARKRHKVGDVTESDAHHNELPPLSKKAQFDDANSRSSESHDVNVTWKMVAVELDSFVLKVYVAVTVLLSIIFLAITGSG